MEMEIIIRLLADGAVIPVALVGAYALLFKVKGSRYEAYCRILMAGLTAYLFAKLIGSVFQPSDARPFELLGAEAGASFLNNPGFPSDHMLFCSAIALAVWFETRDKTLTLVVAGFTLLVGIGRIMALVHSPLDVIGGVVIASLGALWYFQRAPRDKPNHTRQWSKPPTHGKVAQ